MALRFEWDPEKAKRNLEKHGVSLNEGATVFADALSITYADPDHSAEEDRYITVGHSMQGRVLIVSHTDRGDALRIISARRTTRQERKQYEEGG